MKRPLFLIIGGVLIFILVGVWIYVLLYGNPRNISETFADFGFGDTIDTTVVVDPTPPEPEPEPTVDTDTETQRLQQLTTTATAGYQVVEDEEERFVYYIEMGTGHIFSINRFTGEEERISRTTIANTRSGVITPNGNWVLFQAANGTVTFGEFLEDSDTLSTTPLSDTVADFTATRENTFLYSEPTTNGMLIREFDPALETTTTIASVPFREAAISWGLTADSVHYVYPKAARQLKSYTYQIENGTLSRMPVSGFGMSMIGSDTYILYSESDLDSTYNSYTYRKNTGSTEPAPINVVPEKCTQLHNISNSFVCAAEFNDLPNTMPDSWYAGEQVFSDILWEVYAAEGAAEILTGIESISGRAVDAINLQTSTDNADVYFQNKFDKSLWLYERISIMY